MKIQIKHKNTNEIILEGEAANLKEFMEANRGADLSGADLSGADLSNTDLSGADLSGAKIKITQKDDVLKSIGVEIISE